MNSNDVKYFVDDGLILLSYKSTTFFLYYYKFRMLIPIHPMEKYNQHGVLIGFEFPINNYIGFNNHPITAQLIKNEHKDSVYNTLNSVFAIKNKDEIHKSMTTNLIKLLSDDKLNNIGVFYLPSTPNNKIELGTFLKYGLVHSENYFIQYKPIVPMFKSIGNYTIGNYTRGSYIDGEIYRKANKVLVFEYNLTEYGDIKILDDISNVYEIFMQTGDVSSSDIIYYSYKPMIYKINTNVYSLKQLLSFKVHELKCLIKSFGTISEFFALMIIIMGYRLGLDVSNFVTYIKSFGFAYDRLDDIIVARLCNLLLEYGVDEYNISLFRVVMSNIINKENSINTDMVMMNKKNEGQQLKSGDKDIKSSSNEENLVRSLLDCDKIRCGLLSYEKEMLFDIKAGHWDVFEKSEKYKAEGMVDRDPRKDIKKSGVIGIDFGTKSTVVVKQEGSDEIRPIRIGSLDLSAEVKDSDYENPTIISCLDINSFLEKYIDGGGRPETSCEDIFVSYNAFLDYHNCPTENFYAFFHNLKQWANHEKEEVIVQDTKKRSRYTLSSENNINNNNINPIEIYAYYIGLYINNMKNGIYLKYVMSFPVKYSKSVKELIRKSFENGIKKSLPTTIVDDKECMKKFSVEYQISEPAAYAVTALEHAGYNPKDEKEKYLYGVFDFGGGTTDFDFGVWRGASDSEYDSYNCDYVLNCFGADSDLHLGGENILEMIAYEVFKKNKKMAAEKKIACACPVDQIAFIGGENLVNNSQSANRNLTLLKEAFRPLWEQHDDWEGKYKKTQEEKGHAKEQIELQMYDFAGKPVPSCVFEIDTKELIDMIKKRISIGVEAFFRCFEKSMLENNVAKYSTEKVHIFLAGNSSKSVFVKNLFDEFIKKYSEKYNKKSSGKKEWFELIMPLVSNGTDLKYVPNAKTSVAYGLVKSRPGGKIRVIKNHETDSREETRFKYYLGSQRRGNFECRLSPLIKKENGESTVNYNIWVKFQGAGAGVARIYYTTIPGVDISAMSTEGMSYKEVVFEPNEKNYLFVRAVSHSAIEYAVAESEDNIKDNIEKLDIDN